MLADVDSKFDRDTDRDSDIDITINVSVITKQLITMWLGNDSKRTAKNKIKGDNGCDSDSDSDVLNNIETVLFKNYYVVLKYKLIDNNKIEVEIDIEIEIEIEITID